MELFTMICLVLLGVLMLAGGLAMVGMIATLTVLLARQSKRQFSAAWRWLYRREPTEVAARSKRGSRSTFLERESRLARAVASDLLAAMSLTCISGYLVWALAF